MSEPVIIQGGMGSGVSNWRLARAVSRTGQLGVVSGTALDNILVRRLQEGDKEGDMRRALEAFPVLGASYRILDRYFIPGGKDPKAPYKSAPFFSLNPPKDLVELTVAANFVEVYLAKEGHEGLIGINLLEKVQLPTIASLYGALLAGVDYVFMGAGIPKSIPAVLDRLAAGQGASLKVHVQGAGPQDDVQISFDPKDLLGKEPVRLKRPKFIAIVASEILAVTLAKKSSGKVDGFVVEGPTAGGHNAPPRGALQLNEKGEPLYGPRDQVDPKALRRLGLPFWLAGSYAHPIKLKEAISQGAAGIQAGTVFAYCEESGLTEQIKQWVFQKVLGGKIEIFTDPQASPTGFPFKLVRLEDTQSEKDVYEKRERVCDLGYLRQVFKRKDGTFGYRCPGEPVEIYLQKEGKVEETPGRKCLCNGLMANIGLEQIRKDGEMEKPLVTSGDDIARIAHFLKPGKTSYSAAEVIQYLLNGFSDGYADAFH